MKNPIRYFKNIIEWIHGVFYRICLPAIVRPPRVVYNGSLQTINRTHVLKFLEDWRSRIHGRVLDVGVGTWEYPRNLFKDLCEYTSTDCIQLPNVDIVSDIHALTETFQRESFDFVICTDMLQHVAQPWKAVRQLHAILKPGGILLLTAPFNYKLHGTPLMKDYWRFTEDGLRQLLLQDAGFGKVEITPTGHQKFPYGYTVVAYKYE